MEGEQAGMAHRPTSCAPTPILREDKTPLSLEPTFTGRPQISLTPRGTLKAAHTAPVSK